jgi:adenylate cyclase
MSAEAAKPNRIILTPPKTSGRPQVLLTALAGPEQGQVFRITKPTTVVGRSTACDFVLSDPLVSRQHCQVMLGMGGVNLRDLGSTNGTLLNGVKVTEAPLRNQDIVSLGNTRLRFAVEVTRETLDTKAPKVEDLAHKKLLTLYEVGNIVNSVLDLKTLLNIIMSMAIKVMQANRGFLLLKDAAGHLSPVATHALTPAESQAPYSQGIVDTVLKERVPVLVLDAVHDSRFATRESLQALPLSSIICVPIWEKDNIIGVIYVDKAEGTSTFTEEDMYFLSAFANQSAVAITNARLFDDVRREERLRSNLQRYLSPNVVDDIVKKGGGELKLGGEKKRVTILFSDIRGFTPLSEKETPETIVSLLNEYFSAMSDVVFAHEGTLDKFIGDAIMAMWGAPLPIEDPVFKAVQCALRMQERLEGLNAKWAKEGKPQIQVGYGVNTGECIVGNIGSQRRMDYTAIGDMVNVTARIEGESLGGQLLVTEAVLDSLKGRLEVKKLEPVQLKGKSQKLPIFQVDRLKD